MRLRDLDSQVAVGKESTFKGTALKAGCQTGLLIVLHVVIDTDSIVTVNVTLSGKEKQ
jgi:hypothetical protein